MSSGLLPQGLMGTGVVPGAAVFTAWERSTRERAKEREREREIAAAFLCLLDVTKMEICISEKRHCGPLGPKKYKYFNNKHVQCLPPVTAPGYYFALNAESRCWIPYAYTADVFFFFLEVIFMWKVFPADMSFGELSLIKSQSHLRSHIRIDQFSYSWNCSWPLLPWALIQNQQHGHRGLKQLNWVGLREASKSTEGKYQKQQCQLGISGGF